MSISTPQRQRLHETVVSSVLDHINRMGLKPGDALPSERELAKTMAVSRNVLRQGFSVLEERGIIVTRQGAGRYLRDVAVPGADGPETSPILEVSSIADILEARMLLELEVVVLACQRRTRTEATRLNEFAQELRSWSDNLRFHTALAACTHNFMLERLVREQAQLLGDLRQRQHYRRTENRDLALDEHIEIAAAVTSRDEGRARSVMARHFDVTRRAIFGAGVDDRLDGEEEPLGL